MTYEQNGRRPVFQVDHFLPLKPIPNSANWSALVDDGFGQQLVEITPEGNRTIIIARDQVVEVGLKHNIARSISPRHLVDRQTYKERRSAALAEWHDLVG